LGTLTFAISFWREEDEIDERWKGARFAKLYVAFDPKRFATEKYWTAEELFIDGGGTAGLPDYKFELPCLWALSEEHGANWTKRSWFFCVQLSALEHADYVEREVIAPLVKLLRGEPKNPLSRRRDVI
jgi:hypothetical protein